MLKLKLQYFGHLMKELTHWKRPWCWEGLGAGGEGDGRGWDGWMASLTRWTWVWVNSRSWWWTGRPGVLQFMGSQRVGHDWATELMCILAFLCRYSSTCWDLEAEFHSKIISPSSLNHPLLWCWPSLKWQPCPSLSPFLTKHPFPTPWQASLKI